MALDAWSISSGGPPERGAAKAHCAPDEDCQDAQEQGQPTQGTVDQPLGGLPARVSCLGELAEARALDPVEPRDLRADRIHEPPTLAASDHAFRSFLPSVRNKIDRAFRELNFSV